MNKRSFIAPYIVLSGTDDTGVIGGGTGQGSTNPIPIGYEAWLESIWKEDIIQNGTIDEDDYAAWWEANKFSEEDWRSLNPNLPWEEYFGD